MRIRGALAIIGAVAKNIDLRKLYDDKQIQQNHEEFIRHSMVLEDAFGAISKMHEGWKLRIQKIQEALKQ